MGLNDWIFSVKMSIGWWVYRKWIVHGKHVISEIMPVAQLRKPADKDE